MTRRHATISSFFLSSSVFWCSLVPADETQAVSRPSRQYTIEQFLATTTVSGPSISADGSKVLFTSDASGIPNAYTVPFAGGEIVPLTRSTTDSTFAVSYFPEGRSCSVHPRQGG